MSELLGEILGSIRKKESGSWEARYRDPNGRSRGKTFHTKREAQMFIQRVGADIQRGDWLDPQLARINFEQWAQDWLATKVNLRKGTMVGYESILGAHILPHFASLPVGRIVNIQTPNSV